MKYDEIVNCRTKTLTQMVIAFPEKRCGSYMDPSEKNDYNGAPETFLILLMNSKTIDIQKPNPRI
jgi:hypothetical protein